MIIRFIENADWPAIMDIQAASYPSIEPESLTVMQNKAELGPQTSFVAEHHGKIIGYCLAHPWLFGTPPALAQQLSPCSQPDTLYLHDMALAPLARGQGLGQAFFHQLLQQCQQLQLGSISLVAIAGASSYWSTMGCEICPIDKDLSSYTTDACYMVRQL
ncbi:GNAT family N-acetyltransferase [Shewanella waksmanii]|uniref:GNAT family N-acetyltransferase n=1 Tax=Shewanella waksmanii TaxID=213783 RepID=UPI00048FCF7C|nr:GNAT family N-acetyltransferase [Shewanella waksmanii]